MNTIRSAEKKRDHSSLKNNKKVKNQIQKMLDFIRARFY